MLKEERHHLILSQVQQHQKVLTVELSESLSVSEDTIRRDLKELAEKGQLKKVHGGAIAHSLNPVPFRDREIYAHEEKIIIGKKASQLVRQEQVVIMDGGTTNVEVARHFPQHLSATIFTNSIPVAVELTDHPNVEIIFMGGKLLKQAQVTVGEEVIEMIQGLRADICFLGTRSLHPQIGITEIDWEETKVKRAMLQASNELVIPVITEKIGTIQPYIIGKSPLISSIVSSMERKDPRLRPFREMGIEII
ncbi:MAG: DeoR/GlpR family DNA-binding transcription regulator [Bacteroidota bacterium]